MSLSSSSSFDGNFKYTATKSALEPEISPPAKVQDLVTTSDNSCRVHWPPGTETVESRLGTKSSSPVSDSSSGCQHWEELRDVDSKCGRRSLSNASYASRLANAGTRYQVGRETSEGLSVDFTEVRLCNIKAVARNEDKDLRTVSFDCRCVGKMT